MNTVLISNLQQARRRIRWLGSVSFDVFPFKTLRPLCYDLIALTNCGPVTCVSLEICYKSNLQQVPPMLKSEGDQLDTLLVRHK